MNRGNKEVATENNNLVKDMKETVDKSLSTVVSTVESTVNGNKEVAMENCQVMKEIVKANKEVTMQNNQIMKETVGKSLEVSKYTIDKVASASSPSIGKKRKHQFSVDEVVTDSRKQARGTELDIESGMVHFADQYMSLSTALTVREVMTTMSYRVTQEEISTSDPVIIGDIQRFTDQRESLHEVIHLKRELSKAEKDEVYNIGCAIVDQTLQDGPSASTIKNEISKVLEMTHRERHALYLNRNKRKKNSGSKSLLEEKLELELKVEDLEKTVRRKEEKIVQVMDYRIKESQIHRAEVEAERQNHRAEVEAERQNHRAQKLELTERLKSEKDEIVSLYKGMVAGLEAKVAKLEAKIESS